MRVPLCLAVFALLPSLARSAAAPAPLDRAAAIALAAQNSETTWKKLEGPHPHLSSRELFATALAWCEAGLHLDRMERLFDFAARMQDRDPANRSFGNFRWYWVNQTVFDYNAVEFSSRGGALVWMRHRDKLAPSAREKLRELLQFSIEGCLRHRVRESYTNIALMNAGNLILLGEAMENPAAAREGYRRLERAVLYTAEAGIHEYGSPTYYGTDLEDLLLIEAFCREEAGREQARALLNLFWHDIALNFFPPAQKYAGANSRSYDYLKGLGILDLHLLLAGWIDTGMPRGADSIYTLLGRWQPSADLLERSRLSLPRTVRQAWGLAPSQSRTHFLTPSITLSTAASAYGGRMDFPLTADLAGPRDSVRCYFSPDGRGDPYGKLKIPERPDRESHQKALHLSPFWTAAQQGPDALALVIYREDDVPPGMPQLQSHFVMPRENAEFFIGDRAVSLAAAPATVPVPPGESLFLRRGPAALGIRVPYSSGASVALVHDANPFGAVRLTVDHRSPGAGPLPAAAFLVRIGHGLQEEVSFTAWRREFARLPVEVTADSAPDRLSLQAPGLALEAAAPFEEPLRLAPAPSRAVLELDGVDLGRQILGKLEPVRAQEAADARIVSLPAETPAQWEAESGRTSPSMTVEPGQAQGEPVFVWAPEGSGSSSGSVRWRLQAAAPGAYHLWARVLAPTPEDDSFFVRLSSGGKILLDRTGWPLGVHTSWAWVPFTGPQSRRPLPLELPAGESLLELLAREDGTRVDQLFLSRDPAARPPD